MFFTGMPECFAMMGSAGQDPTRSLSTDAPDEEAAGDSSGPASPDMTGVDISPLFQDIVPSGGTNSSRPGTPTSSLAGGVAREVESDGETSEGASEGEHGSTPVSRPPSRSSDGGEMSDAGSSDDESGSSSAASSRSTSPDILSDEGETSGDEREEETVALPAPLLPPVASGRIAEAVHISAPGTEKSSFFAKTVDVAVVAHPSLSGDVVTNFVSRVRNLTAGKCTVNGTKRKVKFDLIGSNNLSSLKNYRVIIYLLKFGFEQWRLAEESFLRDIQPINSRASVIVVSVNSDALAPDADTNMNPTFGFLPFIGRLFDEADPNFSSWTPSQITGVKRGGIAAACVGGAWIAMDKIFKKSNPKKLKKQHKEDKKSEQNQIATSSKHFKKMNAIY